MIGKNVIESKPIQSIEVKEILEEFAEDNELSYEQNITLNHLSRFNHYSKEDGNAIIEELVAMDIKPKVAVRIVNLIPKDLSDLRLIFAKEASHLDKEQMEDILEILGKYEVLE